MKIGMQDIIRNVSVQAKAKDGSVERDDSVMQAFSSRSRARSEKRIKC